MNLMDTVFRIIGEHDEEAKYFGLMEISKTINHLKLTGHVMHHQFNIQQL